MAGGKDCTCGGTGRIYDWNPVVGDPCPECAGGGMTRRGQANMEIYKVKQNCAVVALSTTSYLVLVLALVMDTFVG